MPKSLTMARRPDSKMCLASDPVHDPGGVCRSQGIRGLLANVCYLLPGQAAVLSICTRSDDPETNCITIHGELSCSTT